METATSLPDSDFEYFEQVAARHGMDRSEFFRRAGHRFVAALEGEAELTELANSVISRLGQPAAEELLLHESERLKRESTEW